MEESYKMHIVAERSEAKDLKNTGAGNQVVDVVKKQFGKWWVLNKVAWEMSKREKLSVKYFHFGNGN